MKKTLLPLALVHRACPLCLMARRWPGSFIAKMRAGIAKGCPFCLAAGKVKSESLKKIHEKGGEKNATG